MSSSILQAMVLDMKPSSLLTDDDAVLDAIAKKGWGVIEAKKPDLFLTASQLRSGTITEQEFYGVAKKFCILLSKEIPKFLMQTLMNVCQETLNTDITLDDVFILDAEFDLQNSIDAIEKRIKDEAIAANMFARYLSSLETSSGLSLESIRITTVVKEIVEDAFDDFELAYLRADSMMTREFLHDDIVPFMKFLELGNTGQFPLELLRRKRAEVKSRMDTQRKNVSVHLQRAQNGLSILEKGGLYHIQTNHIVRYAAACSLESLLRAYYALLGSFDLEDVMVENDWNNLQSVAEERAQSIYEVFCHYSRARKELVTTRFECEGNECIFHIHDAGVLHDNLVPKLDLLRLAGENTCEAIYDPVNGALKYHCHYALFRYDHATGPGLNLYDRAIEAMHLENDGLIWETNFKPHLQNIALILKIALQHKQDVQQLLVTNTHSLLAKRLPKTVSYGDYVSSKSEWDAKMHKGFFRSRDISTSLPFVLCKVGGGRYIGYLQDEDCYVSVDDKCFYVNIQQAESIDVLVDMTGFRWTPAMNGSIPVNAVALGKSIDNRPVYCAQGELQSAAPIFKTTRIVPGWIQEGDSGFQYQYKGKAKKGSEYFVLCCDDGTVDLKETVVKSPPVEVAEVVPE